MTAERQEYLNLTEARQLLGGVPAKALRKWVKRGHLQAYKMSSRCLLFKITDLETFLQDCAAKIVEVLTWQDWATALEGAKTQHPIPRGKKPRKRTAASPSVPAKGLRLV
jgi:hypothetical protein